MRRRERAFALPELLAALLISSVLLVGVMDTLRTQHRIRLSQDVAVATDQSLRVASNVIADALRTAGYGVPRIALTSWVPWVSGFNTNPKITTGATDVLRVAGVLRAPVTQLTAPAIQGATVLTVATLPAGTLDTNRKRLILIGGTQHAHVKAATAVSLTIDTNPLVSGNQGLPRAFPLNTTIRRIDVQTFDIATDANGPFLRRDENHGSGPQGIVEGIEDLGVQTIVAGREYDLTLSARSDRLDPITNAYLFRAFRTRVRMRN